MSPTARTLRELRKTVKHCEVTEHWNQYARIRQDMLGFIDVLALDEQAIGVQCCASSSHSARRNKILASPLAPLWLRAGCRIQVWSWGKRKVKRGGKLERWTPRIEEITLEMLPTS
jgi:hypothetical protein